MPGRPRKLSEAKQGEVCALIHSGCTMAAAARDVGRSPLTIQREARRNQEFYEKLRMARYAVELSPVHTLRDAAREDWRAAAWLLERAGDPGPPIPPPPVRQVPRQTAV
jgi:IS30 family transposase